MKQLGKLPNLLMTDISMAGESNKYFLKNVWDRSYYYKQLHKEKKKLQNFKEEAENSSINSLFLFDYSK